MKKFMVIVVAVICGIVLFTFAKADSIQEKYYGVFIGISKEDGMKLNNYKVLVLEPTEFNKDDIKKLENVLWSELGTKEEYEQEYGQKPLGELVREIVGLDMNAAKEAFSAYLENSNLDSRQIYFVNQIVEYIVHNGMMKDLSVLQDAPFTDQGSIVEIFTDLGVWANIKGIIDSINENAAA